MSDSSRTAERDPQLAPLSVDALPQPVVEVAGVSFSRGTQVIFSQLNLQILPGQITAIMGPSGTGKTTLLKLLGGQLQPEAGSIRVFGQDVAHLSRSALFALRSRMGMLFQSGALFTDMSVFENVAFPLRVHTQDTEEQIRQRVLAKLHAVGLRGASDLMPSELSGGMTRRVALARAIVLDPELLMYDEPFVGQDPISMGVLVKLIKSLNQERRLTSIIVSHDVHETLSIADQVYLLAGGRVIASGSPQDLLASTDPSVQQFIHGLPDGPVPFHYPEEPAGVADKASDALMKETSL
ncbi:ABC transporter ATP-binding protein [Marinospirillum sp. MEB164]|uniref:ABC transporter ATP-binding protein n=1 Tax=Marinospirillum alkalitolerans TaxID=3123374 RepID=A0ABW8PXE6_9GAMM